MKRIPENGFTLVEMIAGVAAGAVLALLTCILLVNTSKGWIKLSAEREMMGDADVAMRTMNRIIRPCISGSWDSATSTLSVQQLMSVNSGATVTTNTHLFQKSGAWPTAHLLYTDPWGSTSVLVSNWVSTFSCAVGYPYPNYFLVSVNLTLAVPDPFRTTSTIYETIDMPFSIFLRSNYVQ